MLQVRLDPELLAKVDEAAGRAGLSRSAFVRALLASPVGERGLVEGLERDERGRFPEGNGPGRGYKWADFEVGNTAAMKHGAYYEPKIVPIAEELAAAVIELRPDLAEPSYSAAVKAWARAEARVTLLTRWLDEVGLLDDDGEVRGATRSLEAAEKAAGRCRERLGLDPRADAEVTILRASARRERADLDALVEAGARVRAEVEGSRAELPAGSS